MIDLEAANALLDVIERTGASIAVVGEDYQALPVGHSGAMALFRQAAFSKVELAKIHRFSDPDWADLTARLRDASGVDETQNIADEVIRTGHVTCASSDVEAQQAMVDAWFDATQCRQTIALVTATHAEAQVISEAVQSRRLESGTINPRQVALGQFGQPVFVGDFVQTRRNDKTSGVENRQSWIVKDITTDNLILVSTSDSSNLRKVSHEYASSHLHLGYATRVYGVQGETTDRSIVGPGVDAAGLYVGLTRGRLRNDVVVVAGTFRGAQSELAAMIQRQPTEETIEKSRTAARRELVRASRVNAISPTGKPIQRSPSATL